MRNRGGLVEVGGGFTNGWCFGKMGGFVYHKWVVLWYIAGGILVHTESPPLGGRSSIPLIGKNLCHGKLLLQNAFPPPPPSASTAPPATWHAQTTLKQQIKSKRKVLSGPQLRFLCRALMQDSASLAQKQKFQNQLLQCFDNDQISHVKHGMATRPQPD